MGSLHLIYTSSLPSFCVHPSVYACSPMAFKKPRKTARKVIDRDQRLVHGPSIRTESVIAHNYYEAGPSGVEFTDRVLDVEVHDTPRPAKVPRLQSPPRSERPSLPPFTFPVADVGPSTFTEGASPCLVLNYMLFLYSLTEDLSLSSPDGVATSVVSAPLVSDTPLFDTPLSNDPQRLLDDQAPDNKKKKKARN